MSISLEVTTMQIPFSRRPIGALATHSRKSRSILIRGVVMFSSIAIALTAFACAADSPSDPTAVAIGRPFDAASRALNDEQRIRLETAHARTRWAGEAHDAAMDVVVAAIVEHKNAKRKAPKRGSAAYCAILERAGDAALTVIDRNRGVHRPASARLAVVRQDPILSQCARSLSVFKLETGLNTSASLAAQEYDPEVSGAYEFYLDPMDVAVQGSDGSTRNIQSRLNSVLSQAVSDGIPEGDLLALTAFAGVAVSSAVEWNAFDWSTVGGADSCGKTEGCQEMSVFPLRDSRPLKVITADAVGCFSTVKGWGALKALLVGPAWAALAGECGLRAAIGSGAAIMAMM